jgi:mortality factor 4-like protein 1
MPESTAEIMKGLRCYFDKALPAMLLYKSERQQYTYAIRDDVSPSMVYGAEHLLRLFGMFTLCCGKKYIVFSFYQK